ncbi:hypothetical protein ABIA61_005407 [Paenibacillus sp. RC21]
MNKLTNDEIRQNVRNHYQQIAVKEVNPPRSRQLLWSSVRCG